MIRYYVQKEKKMEKKSQFKSNIAFNFKYPSSELKDAYNIEFAFCNNLRILRN